MKGSYSYVDVKEIQEPDSFNEKSMKLVGATMFETNLKACPDAAYLRRVQIESNSRAVA